MATVKRWKEISRYCWNLELHTQLQNFEVINHKSQNEVLIINVACFKSLVLICIISGATLELLIKMISL